MTLQDKGSDAAMELSQVLSQLGIERGDLLLVHSNVSTLLRTGMTIGDIGELLIEAVGEAGGLLLPTFNFGWCLGQDFDYLRTPSKMGVLSEWARQDDRFVRTHHPVYSFAVAGGKRERFLEYDNPSAYGVGSAFDLLRRLDGKILAMGVPWRECMTFFHHVEERERVPYRFFKAFPGRYADASGRVSEREYFLYVRNLDMGVETYIPEEHFRSIDLVTELATLRTRFSIINAQALYKETAAQLRVNPYFLHRVRVDSPSLSSNP